MFLIITEIYLLLFRTHVKYKTNIRKKIDIPEGGDIILFLVEKLDL